MKTTKLLLNTGFLLLVAVAPLYAVNKAWYTTCLTGGSCLDAINARLCSSVITSNCVTVGDAAIVVRDNAGVAEFYVFRLAEYLSNPPVESIPNVIVPRTNPGNRRWILAISSIGGASWLSGSGVPSEIDGTNGDYYLDTATGDVYLKTAGAWTSAGINLTGPAGLQGPTGPTGPQGPKGDTGATGAQGPQGIQGPQGSQGPQGVQGPEGPTGDTGPAGAQGPEGLQGPQGDPGPQGPTGPTGPTGPQGPKGDTGATGAQGPQGIPGPTGDTGPAGAAGSIWHHGSGGPSAGTGAANDYYLDTASGDIYAKTTSGWGSPIMTLGTTAGNYLALEDTGRLLLETGDRISME